jgi:hypothetical protein
MKVGRPVMRTLAGQARGHVVSDCPLAGKHIVQGAREIAEKDGKTLPALAAEHPIEVFARAYGFCEEDVTMSAKDRRISADDIVTPEIYARERAERRRALIPVKRNRRVEVGPYATFYFENFETMLAQVHEMLHIEKGGAEQLPGELEAYNPLIPQGRD